MTSTIAARPALRRHATEQAGVAAGQLAAGAGNLVFALLAARVLAPGAFAQLAAFLALYLVIHVPAAALGAGGALAPERAAVLRRRALLGGAVAGVAIALAAPLLGPALDLDVPLLVLAGASAPTAGLIALERGRRYGRSQHVRAVFSLLAEPAVRLALGVAAASAIGAVGGAAAVVLAGWAALAVAFGRGAAPAAADGRATAAGPAIAAFVVLAVVQNLDVVLAGALMDGADAGRFAVISTLGGLAAFATTTIPLVLLPRAAAGDGRALAAAVGVALALGAGAVAVVAIAPQALISAVFGDRYADVAPLAVPYLAAMALFGVGRVLFAQLSVQRARMPLAVLGAVALAHVGLVLDLGGDPAGMVTATLVATTALVGCGAILVALRTAHAGTVAAPPARAAARARPLLAAVPRTAVIVAVLTLVGLVLRLLATRGIWLDEAISVRQARLPPGELLHTLRTTDVHPPLHHLVLWAWIHIAGVSELSVRLPSLLASAALVPMLYVAGRDLYDRRAGLLAAAFGAVAPFLVWYAQEARMYALFMLFALIAVWAQLLALRADGGRRHWAIYALASAAMIYTQYFAVLVFAVQQLAFLAVLARDRSRLARWLLATAAIALLLAPLVPFALDQFGTNEAAGKGFHQVPTQAGGEVDSDRPAIYAALTNVVWALWGYHSDTTMTAIAALWPLGMLLALTLLGRGMSRATAVLVACATLPALALFAAGQLKPFVFEVRFFSALAPIGLLLLARGVTAWSRTRLGAAVAGSAVALTLAAGLADQQFNGSNPRRYDFRGALGYVREHARPGDTLVYSPDYLDDVVTFYAPDVRSQPIDAPPPRQRHGRVFVLGSFFDKPQHRAATAQLLRRLRVHRRVVASERLPQIRLWELR